jgi:hypothetical protein
MTKYSNRLWAIVLVLGWIFDFLFWGKSVGVNFAIFISVSLLGGFYLLLINNKKPALKSLWLILPIVFFAIMTFSRQEPLTLFLAYTFTLFSMGILAATYLGGRWTQYSLSDYFYKFFQLLGSMIGLPISFFSQIRKEQIERGETKTRWPILSILRGLLIALPIVACFASLLASADLVFNQKLIEFLGVFNVGRISEYIIRFFIIIFWAYVLAGTFLHVAAKSQDEKLLGEDKPVIKPFMGFTESAIVLGSVIILFLLFVIVQFRYFFGGNLNIGVEGYTFSQYARRGFNELVIVAFCSLVMILGLSTITKRENNLQRRIYSGLSIAIVALVLVILVSAYQRLALAIDWHGFSRLRLYPQVFLVWVGILFVAVVVLEIFHQERYFAFAAVLASIGFAVSLSLFNVDDAIVRHNVLRASQGKHFNASYLATLSADAVPALADEFSDISLSVSVHEGIGAALLCHLHSNAIKDMSNNDWRSFNLSLWNAKNALESVKIQLEGYHVNTDRFPIRVRTPSNVLYECVDTEPNARD